MQVKINSCCDCGLPCIGELCPMYDEITYYCNNCGKEICFDELSRIDGNELCLQCAVYEISAKYINRPCNYTDDILDDDCRQLVEKELSHYIVWL